MLRLNSSKTRLINFSIISLDVTLSGKTLNQSGCSKSLGHFPDREIKYDRHIKVVKKILTQIFVPKRLRKFILNQFLLVYCERIYKTYRVIWFVDASQKNENDYKLFRKKIRIV